MKHIFPHGYQKQTNKSEKETNRQKLKEKINMIWPNMQFPHRHPTKAVYNCRTAGKCNCLARERNGLHIVEICFTDPCKTKTQECVHFFQMNPVKKWFNPKHHSVNCFAVAVTSFLILASSNIGKVTPDRVVNVSGRIQD